MIWLLRIVWFLFSQRMKDRWLQRAKSQGVVAYLRLLQGSRRLLLISLIGFLVIQLALLSFVGLIVTLFLLWDYNFQTKMEILASLFALLFFVPMGLLTYLFSESVWYRVSGAETLVQDAIQAKTEQAS